MDMICPEFEDSDGQEKNFTYGIAIAVIIFMIIGALTIVLCCCSRTMCCKKVEEEAYLHYSLQLQRRAHLEKENSERII